MRIGPLQPSLTLAPDRSLPPLRLGAELQAVVRRSSEGRLLLELASGHLLSPRSRVPLRAGDQLQLRVAQLQPVTVLQILSTRRPEQPLQAGLRALLGSDGSRTNLAAGLSQLLDLAATAPPPLRALLAAVAAQVRRPEQLADPRELAAALRDSGLFLEARLLGQPQERPEQDFKAQLLRLLAQLQTAPAGGKVAAEETATSRGQLSRLAEGAGRLLARLETLQLHAASSQDLDLLFELPLQGQAGPESLQLRIQRERQGEAEAETVGSGGLLVRLRFNFAEDAMGAALHWCGSGVSVYWWAERAATAARLQAALPQLVERLQALGLEVRELHCFEAEPPAVDELPVLQMQGLIDERA
ncbi:MAG: hypothetical protein GX093_08485 [Xanthomonadaceae bacterium]|nr:hypothetical protein [Xanthomonadaceae bacterium]